jgi:hypothetical protein
MQIAEKLGYTGPDAVENCYTAHDGFNAALDNFKNKL